MTSETMQVMSSDISQVTDTNGKFKIQITSSYEGYRERAPVPPGQVSVNCWILGLQLTALFSEALSNFQKEPELTTHYTLRLILMPSFTQERNPSLHLLMNNIYLQGFGLTSMIFLSSWIEWRIYISNNNL